MPAPAELFRHCPRCGAAHPGPVGSNPFRCAGCGLTLFFNPTVAAAGFLFDSHGRALLIRRGKEPAKGKFAIPGGFIDAGETAEEALRREVREEVGVEIADVAYLGSFVNSYQYLGVTYPVVDLSFTARAVDPENAKPLDAVAGIEWRDPLTVDPDEWAFPSLRAGVRVLADRR